MHNDNYETFTFYIYCSMYIGMYMCLSAYTNYVHMDIEVLSCKIHTNTHNCAISHIRMRMYRNMQVGNVGKLSSGH